MIVWGGDISWAMRGMAEQSIVDRVEDGTPDKEKKKRRRSRRSKHNLSSSGEMLLLRAFI